MPRILLAILIALAPLCAAAETYPSRLVTIIVPYGPGGGTDLFARAVASAMGARTGKPVVVDNVAGAGGTIGIQKVMNAPADGYTLIAASGLEYEMLGLANPDAPPRTTDLRSLAIFGTQPMVLVVNGGLGVRTVEELLALAKARPGKISLGTVGPGTALHITGLMIQQAAGVQFIDVPYKGASQLLTDLLSGSVDAAIMALPTVLGRLDDHKLVALAVSEAARSPIVPGVPSLGETPALKNIDTKIGYILLGPRNVPEEVAARIQSLSSDILADKDFRQGLLKLAISPAPRADAADADALKQAQFASYKKAIAASAR